MIFDKAIEIDPEKIYVLETEYSLLTQTDQAIQEIWMERTKGKRPIILAGGIKVARHDEGSIRQRIAEELEELANQRDKALNENVESIAMAKDYFLESARIGQMHKDAQWIRGNKE